MKKIKSKYLLGFLMSLMMVLAVVATPVYAAETGEDTPEVAVENTADASLNSDGIEDKDAIEQIEDLEATNESDTTDEMVVASDSVDESDELVIASEGDTEESDTDTTETDTEKEVAQIIWASGWAGEKYTSLEAALEAANSGQTIRILEDFEITSPIDYGKTRSITIDLYGHTISVASDVCSSTYNAVFALSYNGTWTITDSIGGGKIEVSGSAAKMLFYNRGTIILESGSLNFLDYSGTSNSPAIITNAYASYAAGTFQMTGGTLNFSTTSGSYAYAIVNNNTGTDNAAVSISGGSINVPEGKWGDAIFCFADGTNYSITGGTFTTDPIDYVPTGYAVKTNTDGTYTVVKSDVVFNDNEVFMCGHDVVITSQDGTDDDINLILTYTDEEGSTFRILYTSDTAARIFGGYLTPTVTTTNDNYSITLESGKVDSLRGGSKGFTSIDNISFNSATITVNGGMAGIIATGWYYNQSANTFTVTVNGGTVTTIYGNGETSYVASQYIQSVIDTMVSSYSSDEKAQLIAAYDFISEKGMYVPTVKNTKITINDGTVTYVYGGGKACTQNGSYTTYTSADFSMVTDTADIVITGGNVTYVNGGGFSGPEANWGETSGQDTVIVNSVTITVKGGTIENLYAGGYNGQWKFTYKVDANGNLVFSNYNGTSFEDVRNIVENANVTIENGTITNLYMGGRSYSCVENSNLTVTGGEISTLSMSGNYGYVESSAAKVSGGEITKLELVTRNYVGDIDLNVTGSAVVTSFYAGVGGAYKNSNCNEASYNISTLDIFGDVSVNFDGVVPENAYLTTGLENATSVNINVQLDLYAMNLVADSGYTGSLTTSGAFKIENGTSSTWNAVIYVDPSNESLSFDRNGNTDTTLIILPYTLGVSGDSGIVTAKSIIGEGELVMYALVSSENISSYSTDAYPTTSLTYIDEDGETHSYIFAGWYSYSDGTYSAMESFPASMDAYAKFVDADVLGVKCVVSTVSSGAIRWRFITSTDTIYFYDIGFKVTRDSVDVTSSLSNLNFCTGHYKVTSVDGGLDTQATDFSSISQYIATAYYDDTVTTSSFTVVPYWITGDGTIVEGEAVTFSYSGTYGYATVNN